MELTFNMGIGMVAVVPAARAEEALAIAAERGVDAVVSAPAAGHGAVAVTGTTRPLTGRPVTRPASGTGLHDASAQPTRRTDSLSRPAGWPRERDAQRAPLAQRSSTSSSSRSSRSDRGRR